MGGHAASCFEFEERVPRRFFCLREFGIHAGHVKFLHIVGYNKYFDVSFLIKAGMFELHGSAECPNQI